MTDRTRTIVAVNPSHLTAVEHRFWSNLGREAADAGWQLVQIAARRIPDTPHAPAITFPARLRDFAVRQAGMPHRELARLPFWASSDMIALQTKWEHRRFELTGFQPRVGEGAKRLAWFAERAMGALRPAVVLTTNKIDHPCAMFRQAGAAHGARVAMIERSPFDGIWCEPDGLFSESRIWSELPGWDVAEPDPSIRASVIGNPAGFRRSEASAQLPDLWNLPRPLVFLPFDNLLWTAWALDEHPQRAIDNPAYPDPQTAIDDLAETVARRGGSVVVKPHPSCTESRRLDLPPNVHLVEGALEHLIGVADVVVAFNTKVAFVSLALGRPTVTLADNPAASAGLTVHWRDHPTPAAAIEAGLDRASGPSLDAVDSFFTRLADHFFYGTTDAERRPPRRLFHDLTEGLEPAGRSDPAAFGRLTRIADGEAGALTRRAMPLGHRRREPWRLFLDVSRLVDPASTTSGIARYGRELVARLPEAVSGEVWAVVREPGRRWSMANRQLFDELYCALDGRVVPVSHPASLRARNATIGELRAGDVFHSIHLPLPPPAETGGARRIITIHDALHLMRPELHPAAGPPTIAKVLDAIDTRHDVAVCDSHQTRRDVMQLTDLPGDQVVTVHLGVARATGGPVGRRDGPIVALLQREPRKNAAGIIAAVAETLLAPEYADLRFAACVSPGASDLVADALAGAPGLGDRVDVVDRPTDEMVADLLRSGRAFVFGSSYEGFGLPVLEALSQGCPTVAPINSSLVEVAGSAVSYALSENPHDLAEALRSVLADPRYADELSAAARSRASLFSWEHSVARLARVYDDVRLQHRAD